MDGLTSGRMVHYVMPNGDHRPAIVLQVWDPVGDSGCSNLQVFTDYYNDVPNTEAEKQQLRDCAIKPDEVRNGHIWKTSIMYSSEPKPNTWHWIEKA